MYRLLLRTAIASCLFLGACSPQAQIDSLSQSASGVMTNVKNQVNAVVQPAVNAVNEIDKKVKKVQSGAILIQKGIQQVKEGL